MFNNVRRCEACAALVFTWDMQDHIDWHHLLVDALRELAARG